MRFRQLRKTSSRFRSTTRSTQSTPGCSQDHPAVADGSTTLSSQSRPEMVSHQIPASHRPAHRAHTRLLWRRFVHSTTFFCYLCLPLLTSSGVDCVLRVRTHPLLRDGTDCIRHGVSDTHRRHRVLTRMREQLGPLLTSNYQSQIGQCLLDKIPPREVGGWLK